MSAGGKGSGSPAQRRLLAEILEQFKYDTRLRRCRSRWKRLGFSVAKQIALLKKRIERDGPSAPLVLEIIKAHGDIPIGRIVRRYCGGASIAKTSRAKPIGVAVSTTHANGTVLIALAGKVLVRCADE